MHRKHYKFIWLYITVPDKETGLNLAEDLLNKNLIACGNLHGPFSSIFRWKGQVEREEEYVLVAKTRKALFDTCEEEIGRFHPYECPCIVALPIELANQDYLDWIKENTRA